MGALATAVRIRHDLHSRLLDARARTDEIFRVVREEAMYDRPIPERHRIIFYVGHVEAFDWNLLAYMLHRLPSHRKIGGAERSAWKAHRVKSNLVEIPAGTATLGLDSTHDEEFGWDNEFGAHEVAVNEFAIDNYNVTNHDFLRFVQARGYENRSLWSDEAWAWKAKEGVQHPMFWGREGNLWVYRTMFGEI